ncbi:MAG: PEGA domain-containing protein [Acidobacteriales bacterium]|nr:PEGA domain-containing protein [Terriglobales bacterium]
MGEALRNYRGQPAFHDAATVGMTALNWQPPPTTSAAHPAAPPAGAESLNSSTTQRTGTKKTRRSAGIAAMVLLLAAGIAALVMRSGSPSKVSSSTNPSETSRGTATPSATQPDHPPEPPSLEDSEDSDNHIRVTADGTKVDIPDIAKTIPGMDVLDPNFGSKMVAKVMAGLGGHLIVNTNPPGAKVELDGKTMDRSTPLDLQKVSSGQHELVLTMPGFEGVRMKVPAVPGRAVPINVKLEPVQGPPGQESGGKQTGRLQVQTKPAGATLNLKGAVELVGLTSPSDLSLPPGEYRVTMLLANYIPLNLEVQVRAGKTTKVKESFKTMPR